LYPVYVRGEAYLAAHQGGEAVAEFQKILDHRGIVLNEPIGALAHLQIGRAYAMQGDTTKARAAYQDFLTLWKDADPDIPILIEAKSEYAKLQMIDVNAETLGAADADCAWITGNPSTYALGNRAVMDNQPSLRAAVSTGAGALTDAGVDYGHRWV
jgi:tetratricopeptide (TPR) repeat protein